MSHLNRNLRLRFLHCELRLIDSTPFLSQLTLLSTPVNEFPTEEYTGHRELIGKHLTDIDPLHMGNHRVEVGDILECFDASIVFSLLHVQPRGLQRWSSLQRQSLRRLSIDAEC